MGNWVSREELSDRLVETGIGPVPVWRGEIPLAQLNQVLKENKTLTVIGFDAFRFRGAESRFTWEDRSERDGLNLSWINGPEPGL